jgi:hypothetical protein
MLQTRNQAGQRTGQFTRRHMTVGAIAIIVSIFFHGMLLFLLGDVRLWVVSAVADKLRDYLNDKPVKVLEVIPETPEKVPPREMEEAKDGPPGSRFGKQIEQTKPPTQTPVDPPPPSEQWMAGEAAGVFKLNETPQPSTWEPRREIMAIEERKASVERLMPRQRVARMDRFLDAPDIVVPMDRKDLSSTSRSPGGSPLVDPLSVPYGHGRPVLPPSGYHEVKVEEPAARTPEKVLVEDEKKATPLRHIEKLLAVDVETYLPPKDPGYGYFRMSIKRAGAEVLPVIPKDIILVQDCSASIAEQKMYFCRNGLRRCLELVRPQDRFNVLRFREKADSCFTNWMAPTAEAVRTAEQFIGDLKAEGETDIYGSILNLIQLDRQKGRPVLAFVVSDGRPTTGVLRSSDIIGEFSKANEGSISVCAFGTLQTANAYLLDLLSYCNRGSSHVAETGRWGIPDEFSQLVRSMSRPVLADMRFIYASGSGAEVFPLLTENLYLDRPLVMYGRYPIRSDRLIFQATGQGGETRCDMIFDLSLAKARRSEDKSIRTEWASQKVYHLIGQNARKPDPVVMADILETAREYRIDIPYRRQW